MPTLDFKGKSLVYAHHLTVPFRPLEPDAAKSLPPPKPGAISSKNAPKSAPKSGKPSLDDNLIIHGDNLHALKALMPRYAGRVNCIYIDPPYNTGNEKWVYNDNVNSPMMKEWLKGKSPVDGEDLERHDKWLCMMWPRLQLLRELLAEDGVIFISIDDNEQHRLRMMMGEIFGEENFLGQFVWKSRQNKDNRNVTGVSIDHEYVLCYGKCIRGEERKTGQYSNPDNDPRGDWASGNMVGLATKESRPNLHFDLIDPKTENNYGCPVRGWRYDKKRISKLIADDRILWPAVSSGRPRVKTFLNELKEEFTGFSSVIGDNVFTRNGTKEIEEIFAMRVFEFPKSYELVRQLIIQGCQNDGIVLDSFAGSATTAHAVLALNKEDNGNRKFILVECEDYANKITAERIRRIIKGIPKAKTETLKNGLAGSFTYCTLGEEINIENMLKGKNLPDYETLAHHVAYTATGQAPDKINPKTKRGKDGFFHETTDRMFYLIYEPKLAFLRSNESALNSDRAERITKQAKAKKKTAVVFATHKFIGQKELSAMGIVFCGLPYWS